MPRPISQLGENKMVRGTNFSAMILSVSDRTGLSLPEPMEASGKPPLKKRPMFHSQCGRSRVSGATREVARNVRSFTIYQGITTVVQQESHTSSSDGRPAWQRREQRPWPCVRAWGLPLWAPIPRPRLTWAPEPQQRPWPCDHASGPAQPHRPQPRARIRPAWQQTPTSWVGHAGASLPGPVSPPDQPHSRAASWPQHLASSSGP